MNQKEPFSGILGNGTAHINLLGGISLSISTPTLIIHPWHYIWQAIGLAIVIQPTTRLTPSYFECSYPSLFGVSSNVG